ncbi:G-protein coupled receptor GRL101-like isoform X1 [Leptotrombidium deliense]|uniref:G-protein coupled receptor GRL101-like isoform X1 n=1 Tax=Leptotrombidium deliense TaxID=299467 RepID=A0A443SPQ2_9ACAR|nr:G-protein coupled receptor GRL101-like isoform X1 [Leptotrombidium deliense]
MRCDGKVDCFDSWTDEVGCPFQCSDEPRCSCIDITINCSSLRLTAIPSNIETEISRLIFTSNNFGSNLSMSTFNTLTKAQILDISDNNITFILNGTFKSLWQLKVLYLNDNRIDAIEANTFIGLANLRSLVLKGNRIKSIEALGFNGMSSLKSLDLSNQMLENISRNTFLGLRSLVNLDLSHNNLKTLEEGVFNGLSALIHLDLSRNKFNIIAPRVFHGLTSLTTLVTDEFRFCCLVHPSIQCSPEPDEFSSCEDLMSNIVLRFCIWVLGVIAFFGNVLVLIWRLFNRASNRLHSFLISNLALADLLMGIYLMIIACVDFYYRGVYIVYDDYWRKSALCKLSGFLSTLSSESSVFTLTVITVDRFITIVFPFRLKRMKLNQTVVIIVVIWMACVCIAGIPLLNIEYFDNFYGRSGVCLALHITHQRPNGWEYSVFVYLVVNLISLTIIAFAYSWMFFVAQSSRKAVRAVDKSKNDSTMAKRIMIIIFTDFFCWMPIITLGLLSLGNIKIPPQVFAWIAVFILPLNAALNPIIYTLSTPLFLGGAKRGTFTFQTSVFHSETQRSFVGMQSTLITINSMRHLSQIVLSRKTNVTLRTEKMLRINWFTSKMRT